jgi:hypothetical protein
LCVRVLGLSGTVGDSTYYRFARELPRLIDICVHFELLPLNVKQLEVNCVGGARNSRLIRGLLQVSARDRVLILTLHRKTLGVDSIATSRFRKFRPHRPRLSPSSGATMSLNFRTNYWVSCGFQCPNSPRLDLFHGYRPTMSPSSNSY